LLFVVLVWGLSPTFFKIVLEELQPLTFVFLRFVLLSAVAVSVLAVRGLRGGRAWRIHRRDIPWLVLSGLCGYGVYQLFYMEGLARTTVFSSALLGATVPLWSALILVAARVERIARLQWVGLVVSLAGVAWFLIAGKSHQSELHTDAALGGLTIVVGDLLTLGAAALFAAYGVVNKRLGQVYSPPELMCYTLLIGTAVLAPLGVPAVVHQNWDVVTWHTWVLLPFSVLFPIYLAYSVWNWAIAKRGVGYVTVFTYAVPVLAGLAGWLAFGEALTIAQFAGAALVLGGMLAARHAARRDRAIADMAPRPPAAVAPQPFAEASGLDERSSAAPAAR
jgi:drug/metabolite transporter (DMT)-like permease